MSRKEESRNDEQLDETRSLSTCQDFSAAAADSDEENSQLEVPAHVAAPAAAAQAAPKSFEQPKIDLITFSDAAKGAVNYWPLVLRLFVAAGAETAKTYLIGKKDLELVGAYAAYSAFINIAIGFLYSSIFPLVTLMSAAKREEDEALKALKDADGNVEAQADAQEKIDAIREKTHTIWRQGFIFASMLAGIAVTFGFIISPVFKLLDQPEVVLEHSQKYMMLAAVGFGADVYYRWLARTVSGMGVLKSILVADTLDRILEVALSYLFLNGKFGLPDLGIAGVGLAYTISKILTLAGHLLYMHLSPSCLKFDYDVYGLFKCASPFFHKETFMELVKAGVPAGLEGIVSASAAMLVTMFCGQLGTAPLVGIQVASVYSRWANFYMSAILNVASREIGKFFKMIRNEEILAISKFTPTDFDTFKIMLMQAGDDYKDLKAKFSENTPVSERVSRSNYALSDFTSSEVELLKAFLDGIERDEALSAKLLTTGKYTDETITLAIRNAKVYTQFMFSVCLPMSAVACGLPFLFSEQLATWLIDKNNSTHQAHLNTAQQFLKIQGVFEGLNGFQNPISCLLRALLDNLFLLIATLGCELGLNSGAAATMRYGFHKDSRWVFAATGLGLIAMIMMQVIRACMKLSTISPNSQLVEVVSDTQQAQSEPERSCLQRLKFWSSEKKEEANLTAAQQSLLAAS